VFVTSLKKFLWLRGLSRLLVAIDFRSKRSQAMTFLHAGSHLFSINNRTHRPNVELLLYMTWAWLLLEINFATSLQNMEAVVLLALDLRSMPSGVEHRMSESNVSSVLIVLHHPWYCADALYQNALFLYNPAKKEYKLKVDLTLNCNHDIVCVVTPVGGWRFRIKERSWSAPKEFWTTKQQTYIFHIIYQATIDCTNICCLWNTFL